MAAYDQLELRAAELARLQEVSAIAGWDEACMMPVGAGARRGAALAALAGVIHDKATDPAMGELLAEARGSVEALDDWQRANLAELERSWRLATAVPGDLVRALSLATSRCEQSWREARGRNDWAAVRPLLEEVVGLVRQQADALAAALDLPRYDALLESYEPELRRGDIDPVFADLKAFLPSRIDEAIDGQPEPLPLRGPFPVPAQQQLCRRVMDWLGFDFERGRFDVSHHPFCGGVPDDTRITTRYRDHEFFDALMAICHETGHALYQQGLPAAWREQPVGDALGAAVHESQSLLMELQVCRSRDFIAALTPMVQAAFGREGDPAFAVDNLYAAATRVSRSFIRVEADELTYPLHVILRYELEQALLDGELPVAELPGAWDEAMRRYLGLATGDDHGDGCMQDVHWYAGLFGYFPTYTLGALAAAQWFSAARQADPAIEAGIAEGDLGPLLAWLRGQIHGQGRRLRMQALLESVTGSRLDAGYYKRHVERRYLDR